MIDGYYEFSSSEPIKNIESSFSEFIGELHWQCKLHKVGDRCTMIGKVSCIANLLCDISLEEFEEEISSDFKLIALKNNKFASKNDSEEDIILLKEDAIEINLGESLLEILAVAIPMKKVSPNYRNKELKEIYPEYVITEEPKISESNVWGALKELKLN